ncbi:MAG: hypothetical protein WBM17_11605 [Anaerolineales bacterium]
MKTPVDWLLQGPAWIRYRTRIDLLGEKESSPAAVSDRKEMLRDKQISGLINSLERWPGATVKNHKQADLPSYKLSFLAEAGVRRGDPKLDDIVRKILKQTPADGIPRLPILIPKPFGGSGKVEQAWVLCDAPVILHSLIKMGYGDEARVHKGMNALAELARENGWPCVAAPELGKFRGPGRKDDPCPQANLLMLEALAEDKSFAKSAAARNGLEASLALWAERKSRKPYLFGMGTDFGKLKAPLIWYDLLHVLDVLSRFPPARKDARFKQMVRLLESKADREGRFQPESVWMAWKGWEFNNKKEPSRWITFLAHRVLIHA